jgi:hypothetical protein
VSTIARSSSPYERSRPEVFLDDLGRRERQLTGVLEQRGEPRTVFLDVSGDDRLRQRSVT